MTQNTAPLRQKPTSRAGLTHTFLVACLFSLSLFCPGEALFAQEAGDFAGEYAEDSDALASEGASSETVGHSSATEIAADAQLKAPEDFVPHDPNAPAPCPQPHSPEEATFLEQDSPENSLDSASEAGDSLPKSSQDMAVGGHYPQALTAASSQNAPGQTPQQKREEAKRIKEIKKRIRDSQTYRAIQTATPLPKSVRAPLRSTEPLPEKPPFDVIPAASDSLNISH